MGLDDVPLHQGDRGANRYEEVLAWQAGSEPRLNPYYAGFLLNMEYVILRIASVGGAP